MPRQSRKKKLTKQSQLKCPLCGGSHHITDCVKSLTEVLNKLRKKCQRCSEVTLGGPFCIACSIDRAMERILNVNQNR